MKKIGDKGEIEAINYLTNKGYRILDTNYKYGRIGELDIICEKDNIVVFVEVKKRKNDRYGLSEEYVDSRKKEKILQTIQNYCMKKGIDEETIRFDIVGINNGKIVHYENEEI